MTNKELAKKIWCEYCLNDGWGKCKETCKGYQIGILKLTDMADYKDKQMIELIPRIIACVDQGRTQCASNLAIAEELTNLIKGTENYENE